MGIISLYQQHSFVFVACTFQKVHSESSLAKEVKTSATNLFHCLQSFCPVCCNRIFTTCYPFAVSREQTLFSNLSDLHNACRLFKLVTVIIKLFALTSTSKFHSNVTIALWLLMQVSTNIFLSKLQPMQNVLVDFARIYLKTSIH